MKPQETRDFCREDYGVLGLAFKDIAARRGVSERTLQAWRKADAGTERDWDQLRSRLVKEGVELSQELMQLAKVTARRIRETLENGGDPDKGQLYALKRILDSSNAARRSERDAPPPDPKKEDKRTPAERTREMMACVRKAMGVE